MGGKKNFQRVCSCFRVSYPPESQVALFVNVSALRDKSVQLLTTDSNQSCDLILSLKANTHFWNDKQTSTTTSCKTTCPDLFSLSSLCVCQSQGKNVTFGARVRFLVGRLMC